MGNSKIKRQFGSTDAATIQNLGVAYKLLLHRKLVSNCMVAEEKTSQLHMQNKQEDFDVSIYMQPTALREEPLISQK